MVRKEVVLVAGLATVYLWFDHYGHTFIPANESIRLYAAQAVVDHGALSLDPVLAAHGVRNLDQAEFEGHAYLDKAPGLSLAAIPFYALGTRLGLPGDRAHLPLWLALLTGLLVAIPGAFGCLLVRRTVLQLGGSDWSATAAALTLGLATPFALYSTLFFGHGPAAVLAAATLWAATANRPALAGACAGAMVLVETQTALLAVALLWPLTQLGPRSLLRGALGALPFAAVQLAYNAALFEGPLDFAYAHKSAEAFQAVHGSGLFGIGLPSYSALLELTLGAHRGLLVHAPVLLGAAAAVTRRAARLPLAAFLIQLTVIAGFSDWAGGDAWGPRHLVPALPAVAVAFGLGLDRLGAPARGVLAALAGASALGAWLPIATFPYAMAAIPAPLAQLGWSLASQLQLAPSQLGASPIVGLIGLSGVALLPALLLAPRRWLAPAAVGALAFAGILAWVPPAKGPAAKARDLTDCLMDRPDAAAARCFSPGVWSDKRCQCQIPKGPGP